MVQSLAGLQYHLIKNTVEWDKQYQEFREILAHNCEVVALTHTPRNIGQINIQILFYLPTGGRSDYTAKHFQTKGQDLSLVLDQAMLYLNTFIQPHNLVSFSVFEDDHPCPDKFYHVVVLHKGGEPTAPFARSEEIRGDVYRLETRQSQDGWERQIYEVCMGIENRGVSEHKFLISTYNYSDDDRQAVAVLQWSKVYEDLLTDASRGGCSCLIF